MSDGDARADVTKDSDVVQTFSVTGHASLLFISTGNVGDVERDPVLHQRMPAIEGAFESWRRVKIPRTALIVQKQARRNSLRGLVEREVLNLGAKSIDAGAVADAVHRSNLTCLQGGLRTEQQTPRA